MWTQVLNSNFCLRASKKNHTFVQSWCFIWCQIFLKIALNPLRINCDWLGLFTEENICYCAHTILYIMSQQYVEMLTCENTLLALYSFLHVFFSLRILSCKSHQLFNFFFFFYLFFNI